MKPPIPHPLLRNLALLGCLLALMAGGNLLRAQTPVAQNLDIFFGVPKLLPLDHPIDDFSVAPDNVVKVEKVDGSPNQLSITGIGGGNATLTVKSNGETLVYDLAVSAEPERIYINLNESKRLTFPNPIDDDSVSNEGIVKVIQPDSSDKVLLVEANEAGKTTLTVYCKGDIYRYFISTFENRGADVLEIQNAFSAKGYRNLTITFDKDQAIVGGTVPTQEELDDAVKIVKQFTQFVIVKAQLGQEAETSEYTEEEQLIINNIQRIAGVKGLTIRVKFPAPTVITTSTYTTSIGDYVEPRVVTTPQGGTIRGSGFNAPKDPNSQGPNPTGTDDLEPKPQKNTTEVTTTTKNTTIPEKIFLYGDLQDDLEEARVLRVARTFCPFVVNFITVKDPIQIRTQLRFMQVSNVDTRDIGFDWTGGGTGPTVTLGFGASAFDLLPNPLSAFKNFILNPGTAFTGVTAAVDATAVLHLFETLGLTKQLREADLLLTNGQPGWYSEGEIQTYLSQITPSTLTTAPGASTSSVFLGLNMDISPLNSLQDLGRDPSGQKVLGLQAATGTINITDDGTPSNDKVGRIGFSQAGAPNSPEIDNTVKYVDENGLIGLNISTQLTVPGAFQTADVAGISLTLPDIFVRSTRTRANLRDGQTVTIDGLIDKEMAQTIRKLPFFADIPIFDFFFKNNTNSTTTQEVVVLVTPHIVRMRDPDSSRYPQPKYPEMQDLARAYGDVPIIQPVRYDAHEVDIRPEGDSKDSKDVPVATEAPLAPRASAGMHPIPPPPIDSSPNSAPIGASAPPPPPPPLAPPSTLP